MSEGKHLPPKIEPYPAPSAEDSWAAHQARGAYPEQQAQVPPPVPYTPQPYVTIGVPQQPVKKSRDRAQYVRQQKGHSLILNLLLIGPLTLWTTTLYYSVSPNHFWHA